MSRAGRAGRHHGARPADRARRRPAVAAELALDGADDVVELERLRSVDGEPNHVAHSFLPAARYPAGGRRRTSARARCTTSCAASTAPTWRTPGSSSTSAPRPPTRPTCCASSPARRCSSSGRRSATAPGIRWCTASPGCGPTSARSSSRSRSAAADDGCHRCAGLGHGRPGRARGAVAEVWRALAVLQPYCAVCDVSYVVSGSGGAGTTFVCASRAGSTAGSPGRRARRATIVDWRPGRLVATRLVLTPETWTTRIELADTDGGGTRVTMTITHEPTGRRPARPAAAARGPSAAGPADGGRRAGEGAGARRRAGPG